MKALRQSTLPVGVWSAHCRPPTTGAPALQEQLLRAWRYQSWLVGLELHRRRQYREARTALDPELPALELALTELTDRIEQARTELRLARQSKRSRVEYAGASDAIKSLRLERKALITRVREARATAEAAYGPAKLEYDKRRKALADGRGPRIVERANADVLTAMLEEPEWPEAWKVMARLDAEHVAARKSARADCGLTPGTYLLVERAADASSRERTDPARPRFRGEGRIGVQVHRLSAAELLSGSNKQIHLSLTDKIGGRGRRYGTLRLRVGPETFAEFPVKLWRPLPPDSVITQAWVLVTREGPRSSYRLQLTTETTSWARPAPVRGAGVVAVDVGWRVVEGGIRVAYFVDDHGRHGEIVVPEKVRSLYDHASRLRSFSDQHFDRARIVVAEWLAEHPSDAPAWMPGATQSLSYWRAHWKLDRWVAARLTEYIPQGAWQKWRDQRRAERLDFFGTFSEMSVFLGEASPLEQLSFYLDAWRRKDLHLYDLATRARGRAERRRRELFRKVAQIARQYEHVLVEDIDLTAFTRNAPAEQTPEAEYLHSVQRVAAPGLLLAILKEACGDRVTALDPANTTRTCYRCGFINTEWAVPEELRQQCGGCRSIWDQDENACRVMLAQWYDRFGGAENGAGARDSRNAAANASSVSTLSGAP